MEKRLYRLPRNKMIGGVCTGLGEYFSIDPVLVRLVFIILAFQQGIGILAYIILWIVVPVHPGAVSAEAAPASTSDAETSPGGMYASAEAEREEQRTPGRGTLLGGVVLILIGLLFLFDNFFPGISFADFWPLLLIAVGTGMLWNSWPRQSDLDQEVAS